MTEFKGNILIFVDGYKVEEIRCHEHNLGDDYFFAEAGYAVGDNPRDRYCARSSRDKIRRFKDYDEAVSYIHLKQRKFPVQRFQLIYEVNNKWLEVSMLDDILAIDTRLENEAAEADRVRKEWRDRELPCLDVLLEKHNLKNAMLASALLAIIRSRGEEEAKKNYARATYYRLAKMLKESELL